MACSSDSDCGYGYVCVGGQCMYGGRDDRDDYDGDGLSASMFLNTLDKSFAGYALVDPSDAVDWTKLARTTVGTLITLAVAGVYGLLDGLVEIVTNVWSGTGQWIGTLIATILATPAEVVSRWAAESLRGINSIFSGDLGILAFPVGVAVVMLTLWFVAIGVREVR